MATIRDIATLAGVSRGTVDRVLNKRGGVNRETQERILKIMEEVQFTRNPAGIALAAQKKKCLIGMILFSKKNPFFDTIENGFLMKAEELAVFGCEIKIKRIEYSQEAQLKAIKELKKIGIDGLIMTPYDSKEVRMEMDRLRKKSIPIITVNSDIENIKRLAYVGENHFKSGKVAGALMEKLTENEVFYSVIGGDKAILSHRKRAEGFINHLKEINRFHLLEVCENYDDDEICSQIVNRLLEKYPEMNAIFFLAAGTYGGCKVLERISDKRKPTVITFDEVPTTVEMMKKGVITATICQEPEWQGSRALELMFSYLNRGMEVDENNYANLSIKIGEMYGEL